MAHTTPTESPPSRLDKVRPILGWVVVPCILAAVAGLYVNFKVPWLAPMAVAVLLVSFVPVWPVVTAKQTDKVNWGGIFWLVVHVLLVGWSGYIQWEHLKWSYSPWFGFFGLIAVWVVVILVVASVMGSRKHGSTHSNGHATNHGQANGGSDAAVRVTQQLAAKLGLPVGTGAEVDLGELVMALKDRAIADKLEASAADRREIRETLQWALANKLIDASEITAEVRRLCRIEAPIESVEEQSQKRDFSARPWEIPTRSKRKRRS